MVQWGTMNIKEEFQWQENPFTLKILPQLFVGYDNEIKDLERHIEERDKLALLLGPTGAGKTTMLKWISDKAYEEGSYVIYITKPPEDPEEFISIFLSEFPMGVFDKILGNHPTLYDLHKHVNKKTKGSPVVIFIDEAHEADVKVLEWLRTFIDQIEESSFILAGLPILDNELKDKIETLDRRVTTRVSLTALSKSETEELIRRRIKNVGGEDIKPFTLDSINAIYNKTGGFPREVLKVCNELVKRCEKEDIKLIDAGIIDGISTEKPKEKHERTVKEHIDVSLSALPDKQESILRILMNDQWITPQDIAEHFEEDYKSIDHAVRSINNILNRLRKDNYVVRKKQNRTYVYNVADRIKTALVDH